MGLPKLPKLRLPNLREQFANYTAITLTLKPTGPQYAPGNLSGRLVPWRRTEPIYQKIQHRTQNQRHLATRCIHTINA